MKLTDKEKIILESIDLNYIDKISRDVLTNNLFLHWVATDIKTLAFNGFKRDLFSFIQNGEEYNIEELLDNEI